MAEELTYQSMKLQNSGHMTHRSHFVSCFSTLCTTCPYFRQWKVRFK